MLRTTSPENAIHPGTPGCEKPGNEKRKVNEKKKTDTQGCSIISCWNMVQVPDETTALSRLHELI